MDEEVKSKLIMDKEDLAGEEIESTGFSSAENSSNVPKFFKERMAKQHGNTKDEISITELNDDKDVPEFNVPKEQKQAAFRDPYAEMLGMEPGKDPEDYQTSPASRTGSKEKKDTGDKQKTQKETSLRFDDEKPVKQESSGVLSKAGKAAGTAAGKAADAALGIVHAKITEAEDDNSAVEAAHSTEIAGEASAKLIYGRLKDAKPASRLKFDEASGGGAGVEAYKVSRADQKKGIQRTYADNIRKARQAGRTVEKAEDVAEAGTSVIAAFRVKAGRFVRRNKAGIATLLFCGIVLMFFISGMGTLSSLIGEAGGAIVESTFLSSDEDIYAANNQYLSLEAGLQSQINRIESTYPGYDEYRYQVDEITHEPYSLISYLTAKYGDFTISDVQSEMTRIFQKQFKLKVEEETEIRTRTVTKTGTREVVDEETGEVTYEEYEYEEEEQYEWHILNIKLTNKGMAAIAMEELNSDQKSYYLTYMATLGNRSYLFGDSLIAGDPSGGGMSYEIPPEALSDEKFARMIREAEKYLGYPYVWGGSSPETSFDCSGFVCWVINHCGNGWNVGRRGATGLLDVCTYVSPEEAKPGDLIFFHGTYNTDAPASHVAIYVGNGMMIHCGDPIQYTSINSNYWQQHFYCFGRIK
nr:C40 family peptidase [Clostridia bacterium]